MWRWSSPRVQAGVALSISPAQTGKRISAPWEGTALGSVSVTSSCEPAAPSSSQCPGAKAGEEFPDYRRYLWSWRDTWALLLEEGAIHGEG